MQVFRTKRRKLKDKKNRLKNKNITFGDVDPSIDLKLVQMDQNADANSTIFAVLNFPFATSVSLGTGCLNDIEGSGSMSSISFTPSFDGSLHSGTSCSTSSGDADLWGELDHIDPNDSSRSTSFLRTADLGLELNGNYSEHPISLEIDPKESWVGLDSNGQTPSQITTRVLNGLVKKGISTVLNTNIWDPVRKTKALLKEKERRKNEGLPRIQDDEGGPLDKDLIFIWSGRFADAAYYGHELPIVKACGIINMSATNLIELLLDSERANEYNKMSVGRSDELVLANELENEHVGVIKVVRSRSKPPLLRILEFVTLMHVRKLRSEDGAGKGYVMVSRDVTRPVDAEEEKKGDSPAVIRSEILMNVTIAREIEGYEGRCEMINVNHVKSPMVPLMIGKKIGIAGAFNFINDIRSLC